MSVFFLIVVIIQSIRNIQNLYFRPAWLGRVKFPCNLIPSVEYCGRYKIVVFVLRIRCAAGGIFIVSNTIVNSTGRIRRDSSFLRDGCQIDTRTGTVGVSPERGIYIQLHVTFTRRIYFPVVVIHAGIEVILRR